MVKRISPWRKRVVSALFGPGNQSGDWLDKEIPIRPVVRAVLGEQGADIDMEATFGPQWLYVVELVRRAATLSHKESAALYEACQGGDLVASEIVAWRADHAAALDAGADPDDTALHRAAEAASYVVDEAALEAASAAATALAIHHLIGSAGFTKEHYDSMSNPWRTVIDDIHPDDVSYR